MDGISLVEQKDKLDSPKLGSVFIVCHNLNRSLAFYEALGFPLQETKKRSYVLSTGSSVELHLHQKLSKEERRLYGVEWASGSQAFVCSYEVEALEPLLQVIPPENLVRQPIETPWGTRLMMVADPDGHLLELRERKRRG